MPAPLNRRNFLRAAAAGGLAFGVPGLWSPAFSPRSALAAGPLNVAHFGGPYQILNSVLGKPFTDAGNGEVVFEAQQSALIVSKWQASPKNPPYDIGLLVRSLTLRARNANLTTPLTVADIPNLANAVPLAAAPQGAGVAIALDCVDIAYDRAAAAGEITSWLDLWNPAFKGKIMLPGMPLAGLIAATLVSVARATGGNERTVDKVFDRFKELKGSVRSFYSDPNQVTQALERQEIVAAPQYSARIGQLMQRSARIARATPKEGVPAVPYDFALAAGSEHQVVGKKFINFALDPQIQKAICSSILLNPVIPSVKLDPEQQRLIVSDAAKLFQVDDEYVSQQQAGWAERWQREIQS